MPAPQPGEREKRGRRRWAYVVQHFLTALEQDAAVVLLSLVRVIEQVRKVGEGWYLYCIVR